LFLPLCLSGDLFPDPNNYLSIAAHKVTTALNIFGGTEGSCPSPFQYMAGDLPHPGSSAIALFSLKIGERKLWHRFAWNKDNDQSAKASGSISL
jgi:hypothetical protein